MLTSSLRSLYLTFQTLECNLHELVSTFKQTFRFPILYKRKSLILNLYKYHQVLFYADGINLMDGVRATEGPADVLLAPNIVKTNYMK